MSHREAPPPAAGPQKGRARPSSTLIQLEPRATRLPLARPANRRPCLRLHRGAIDISQCRALAESMRVGRASHGGARGGPRAQHLSRGRADGEGGNSGGYVEQRSLSAEDARTRARKATQYWLRERTWVRGRPEGSSSAQAPGAVFDSGLRAKLSAN